MLMFNTAELPAASDPDFLSWLNRYLFTSGDTVSSGSLGSTKGKELIIDILWCYAEQLSKPTELFPCLAVLTKRKFFVEKLTSHTSSFHGVPELKPCSLIAIQNIQQLVLGPCHAFLRLEESFVGKGGVFTLFGTESQDLKRFFSSLFHACCDFDIINSYSFVDLTVQSDLLKTIASREEQNSGMPSDRLVSAALVQIDHSLVFYFLILSENRIYCLDTDCVHWPPATFQSSHEASIRFHVQYDISIMDIINNIKIYSAEDYNSDMRNMILSSSAPDVDVQFLQHELSLEVVLPTEHSTGLSDTGTNPSERIPESSQKHNASISYYFPSAASRDLFLDRLSNMRTELAHRMSPHFREEPEGGNEQTSPFDIPSLKSRPLPSSKLGASVSLSKGFSFTAGQITAMPEAVHNEIISDASTLDLENSHVLQLNSQTKFTFNESIVSESGVSSLYKHDAHGKSVGQYQTLANSSAYCASSPRLDLSTSPMSNFSRASISPDFVHEPERKQHTGYYQGAEFTQKMAATKADSLPSSFDWKKYYFGSLPCMETDTVLRPHDVFKAVVGHKYGSQFEILNQRFLEDIESSSEFEAGSCMETEHELDLKQCLKSYDLIQPLSTKLKPLCLMNGRELNKYFHLAIAHKPNPDNQDRLPEELHYVFWSMVVPYTNPRQEITTLIMLSTCGIYLVSDTNPKVAHKSRPSWMAHSRNRSDSALTLKSRTSPGNHKLVEPYFVFGYKDLLQVNVGMFDQCVRLTGHNENSVFTIATRDSVVTETFIDKLKHVLSFIAKSPVVERNRADSENDFYRASFQQTKSTVDGMVYTHPSQVKFHYPGEDSLRDMLYLVNERAQCRAKLSTSQKSSSNLWFYMQCYLLPSEEGRASERSQPRSVVITENYFCLTEEDIVTYPLPDFVRGVPENPCHSIIECRQIDNLKRITLFHGHPHLVCLTFLDETEGIVVAVSMQHFGKVKVGKEKQNICPEVTYKLFIQGMKERDKMVQVLDTLWRGQVTHVGRILDINRI